MACGGCVVGRRGSNAGLRCWLRSQPMRRCSFRGTCQSPGVHPYGNKSQYCSKHRRFLQMRRAAKERGCEVPSFEWLEGEFSRTGMLCSHCGKQMVWLKADKPSAVISLQHDDSGLMRFLCLSCNSRHGPLGDMFYSIPFGTSWCAPCGTFKPVAEFYKSKTAIDGCSRYCKKCINWRTKKWQEDNKEHYKEYKHEWGKQKRANRRALMAG